MDKELYNIPVLFIVFNRLDTVMKVFSVIQKIKPKKLYVASDGQRNEQEKEKVKKVRKYILNKIDWDCDLKTFFRDGNVGCRLNVAGAISWFFNNEEFGIILEDDCLPNSDFFRFCQEMLEKYKNDERIMQVAGTKLISIPNQIKSSYHFWSHSSIWGWATWRRAWEKYCIDQKLLPVIKNIAELKTIYPNFLHRMRMRYTFYKLNLGLIDTWDFQWEFTIIINNGLTIVPHNNMISNIGFGNNSTNTHSKSKYANLPLEQLPERLVHPKYILCYNKLYRLFYWSRELNIILSYLKNLIGKGSR